MKRDVCWVFTTDGWDPTQGTLSLLQIIWFRGSDAVGPGGFAGNQDPNIRGHPNADEDGRSRSAWLAKRWQELIRQHPVTQEDRDDFQRGGQIYGNRRNQQGEPCVLTDHRGSGKKLTERLGRRKPDEPDRVIGLVPIRGGGSREGFRFEVDKAFSIAIEHAKDDNLALSCEGIDEERAGRREEHWRQARDQSL